MEEGWNKNQPTRRRLNLEISCVVKENESKSLEDMPIGLRMEPVSIL